MSCRSTPAGSLATTLARLRNDRVLSDAAVLSIFHEIRRDPAYSRRQEHDPAGAYQRYLNRAEQQIEQMHHSGEITDARRASLLARLQEARNAPLPETETISALGALEVVAVARRRNLEAFIRNIAVRSETSEEATWEAFREAESTAPRRRGRHAVEQHEPAAGSQQQHWVVANDPSVTHAMTVLEDTASTLEIARARSRPQRARLVEVTGPADTSTGVQVRRAGYDPRVRHLVVETASADGTVTTHAYRGIPDETWQRISAGGDPSGVWAREVRGNPDYQYANEREAAIASVASRCPNCGQYADADHACPVPVPAVTLRQGQTTQRWSNATTPVLDANGATVWEDSVRLPAIRELRQHVANGSVKVAVGQMFPQVGSRTTGWVTGTITVSRTSDGSLAVATAGARCTCSEYQARGDCVHLHQIDRAVRDRVDPPTRSRTPMTAEERDRVTREAQARADAAAVTDWTRDATTAAEAARTWRADSDVLYSQDPEAFRQDVQAAREAAAAKNGEPAIPYMRENAFDGMAARGSGRGFGMEIEFDFPPGMDGMQRSRARRAIASELYAEGITRGPQQERYGHSRQFGFVDTHTLPDGTGTWCFEDDGSVSGGELVTPVMYDEPETWTKLEKAVEIIRRNGGVPSRKAGAHVHVGTPNATAETYTEMTRLVTQHEDVMYRLASDPARGTHRNNGYSQPLTVVPPDGFDDISALRAWQRPRYSMVNFHHVSGTASDHPEFRLFDSTLDPGAMQAQAKIAVATAAAAERNAATGGTARGKEEWGAHRARAEARQSRRRMTDEEFDADSATTRSLLDTLFRRREDKAQLAAVFANTKWAKPRAR